MKDLYRPTVVLALFVSLLAPTSNAQSGGSFSITKSVIAGGGGNSTGGGYNLDGTTGQCVAGTILTGGAFTLASGFWAGGSAGTPTPTATPTSTPTSTPTATPTATPTSTPTPTPTPGGAGFEADVAPRPNGDGNMLSTDVTQMRRFAAGLDTPDTAFNELQRADSAPRASFGDGVLNAADVVQARRYAAGLDPLTEAGGPLGRPSVPENGIVEGLSHYFSDREVLIGQIESSDPATVAVPVEIVGLADETAIGFTLEYDSAMLRSPQVTLAEGAPEDAVLTVNYDEQGRIGILVDSTQDLADGDEKTRLVTVTFAVLGRGFTTISFTGGLAQLGVSDGKGEMLATRWQSRAIRLD